MGPGVLLGALAWLASGHLSEPSALHPSVAALLSVAVGFVVGGAVVRSDGSPATAVRHLLRNALKGLVMLSPILALPTIASRRGVGVPEVIADTAVVRA